MSGRGRGYGGFGGSGGGRGGRGGGPAWHTRSRVPPLAIPATKVYVGGLPLDFECQQLYDLFSTVGHVVECTLLKGYGFVHFSSPEEGQRAMIQLNNYQVAPDFWLHVKPSTTKLCPIPGVYGQEMCYYCMSNEHSYTDCPMYKDEYTEKVAQKKEKSARWREAMAAKQAGGTKSAATGGTKSPEPKKQEGNAEGAEGSAMEVDKSAAAASTKETEAKSAGGEASGANEGSRAGGPMRSRGSPRGGRGRFGSSRGSGYGGGYGGGYGRGGGGRYNLRPGSGPTIKSFNMPRSQPFQSGGFGGAAPLEATFSAAMGYGTPSAGPFTYVPPPQPYGGAVPFTGVPPPGFSSRY